MVCIDGKFDKNNIIQLYTNGYTSTEIASLYSSTHQTILKKLNSWGINTKKSARRINLICNYCKKEFSSPPARPSIKRNQKNHYCSYNCWDKSRKEPNVTCNYCGNKFHKQPSNIELHNFCNLDCRNLYQKIHPEFNNFIKNCHKSGEESSHYIEFKSKILNICKECKNEFLHNPTRIRSFCSINCRNNFQKENPDHNGFMKNCHKIGNESPNWKGGINRFSKKDLELKENQKALLSIWRKEIYKKDDYTCQICNSRSRKGYKPILNAHHIKSFKDYPELRFDINNGVTLCVQCHKKVHFGNNKI
jgi:hypothetical protein